MLIDKYDQRANFGTVSGMNSKSHDYEFCRFLNGKDNKCGRLAFHFMNDPLPKFILKPDGIVLNANVRAARLIDEGILNHGAFSGLDYGTPDNNSCANSILRSFGAGRTSYKRIVKRLFDDDWIVFEFSKIDDSEYSEILLTVKEGKICLDEELNAVAKAFNLTLTETDVVHYMSKAYCPKEISNEMGISVNTVRAHLRSIYSKIGVRGYNKALRLILQLVN